MDLARKILVLIDPSPCSLAALLYAAQLAELLGAHVDALHIEGQDTFKVGSSTPLAPDVAARLDAQMAEVLDRAKQRLGDKLTTLTEKGDPLTRILEAIERGGYDLAVMGTHGRIGRLQALLGSVAEGVVRNAKCPVLTIRVPVGHESFAEKIHDVA